MNEKQILARYRRMRAWVARERNKGRRDQVFLRRGRLVEEIDLVSLRELVRELKAFKATES